MKITHKQFTAKWYGKKYNEPGFGYECVAIPKLYYQEVFGITLGSFGGSAHTGWTRLLNHKDLVRVEYKQGLFPPQGAIVFFSQAWGPDAHVEVANKFCNSGVLRTFGQNVRNSKTGEGVDAILPHWYDYSTCRGWYIKK